jgi:acyl-CoA synthetase (NDP forming)
METKRRILLMSEIEPRFQPLFNPKSVAFIGASNTPNKWGFIVLANLINGGFQGPIYPINPRETKIQGLKAYASVADLPETPDLAVIVIPPLATPLVINECVSKGIRAGLVITAGFAEVGIDGERLQREMVDKARKGGMVLVGPNCNGIMRPSSKLYPLMPPVFPPPGPMAVVSQSGNVATSIIRRLMKSGFGCSCFVSSGNEADLHCEDYFEYMGEDTETRVILSYIEGFREGRRFFQTAKRVSKKKPIIMLKAGGTAAGARAAKSHTASLAGADLAFDGACKQAGIIRAKDMDELRNIGAGFIRQPLPRGRRVGIVTAGGGWGVLAADACVKADLEVVTLPEETIAELDSFLPPWWSRSNPVDLVAGLREDNLRKSLESLLRCPKLDGVIVLGIVAALPVKPLPPSSSQDVIERRTKAMVQMIGDVYDQFMGLADSYQKPVIIGSEFPFALGDLETRMAYMLGERGYICYPGPEDAAVVMASLASYAQYLHSGA